MTLEEDIKILRELRKSSDIEVAHMKADDIILKYVPRELAKEYNKIDKWYA